MGLARVYRAATGDAVVSDVDDDPFYLLMAESHDMIRSDAWEYGGALSIRADFLHFVAGGDVVADAESNALYACVKCGEWEE